MRRRILVDLMGGVLHESHGSPQLVSIIQNGSLSVAMRQRAIHSVQQLPEPSQDVVYSLRKIANASSTDLSHDALLMLGVVGEKQQK